MNIIDGLHLIVDGNVKDPAVFGEENLREMLRELVFDLGMQLIYGPIFHHVAMDPEKLTGDVFRDEGGVSGIAVISTSHLAVHCWPLRRTFMFDAFSCRHFDHSTAMKVLEKRLEPSDLNVRVIARRPNVVL